VQPEKRLMAIHYYICRFKTSTLEVSLMAYEVWPEPRRRLSFSKRELMELFIAAVVLLAVGFSWLNPGFTPHFTPAILAVLLVGVLPAFLLHEIAHKYAALRYGAWAEFRLDAFGLAITALSIIAPFKIIAPGAVMVWSPYLTLNQIGKISISGPLTNLALAAVFIMLLPFVPGYLTWFAVRFNAFVAFFNLLPLGIFDGRKIIAWNWRAWLLVFLASISLMVWSYL